MTVSVACRYKWNDAKGQAQTSEHLVDSEDPMWAELRHAHIADVGNTASTRLKEFANSKLARLEREGTHPLANFVWHMHHAPP